MASHLQLNSASSAADCAAREAVRLGGGLGGPRVVALGEPHVDLGGTQLHARVCLPQRLWYSILAGRLSHGLSHLLCKVHSHWVLQAVFSHTGWLSHCVFVYIGYLTH